MKSGNDYLLECFKTFEQIAFEHEALRQICRDSKVPDWEQTMKTLAANSDLRKHIGFQLQQMWDSVEAKMDQAKAHELSDTDPKLKDLN